MSDVPYEAFLQITRKKAQYGRYLDTKQWGQFQHIALPNARLRFYDTNDAIITRNGKSYDFDSIAAFIDWFSVFFGKAQTLHMFGPPEMTLLSADEISVIWSMEDQIYFQPESRLAEIRGGGYYHEVWVRENDSWWLKDLALKRTYQKLSIASESLLHFSKSSLDHRMFSEKLINHGYDCVESEAAYYYSRFLHGELGVMYNSFALRPD